MFNAFRRSGEFYCYTEPVHEVVLHLANWAGALDDLIKPRSDLRHPETEHHYFSELNAVKSAWKNEIDEAFIYGDPFAASSPNALAAYLSSLVEAAPKRAFIQECRTIWRLGKLKDMVPGHHLTLLRHPWDQWHSYKSTDYFDIANHVFLNQALRAHEATPSAMHLLKDRIGFERFECDSIADQFAHFSKRRLAPEENYVMFFSLWAAAQIESLKHSDFEVYIDLISTDTVHREKLQSFLKKLGIQNVQLEDCQIPQLSYSRKDSEFFEPLEKEVWSWFQADKSVAIHVSEVQEKLDRLRRPLESRSSTPLTLIRAIERREARKLDQLRETIGQLNASAVNAQAGAEARISELERTLKLESENTKRNLELELENARRNLELERESARQNLESERAAAERERAEKMTLLENQGRLIGEFSTASQLQAQRISDYTHDLSVARSELDALRQSASWRVTAPGRWVSRAVRGLTRKAAAVLRTIVRVILACFLEIARSIPGGTRALRVAATPFPPLKRKLIHFASVRLGPAQTSVGTGPRHSSLSELKDHAVAHNGSHLGRRQFRRLRAKLLLQELVAQESSGKPHSPKET